MSKFIFSCPQCKKQFYAQEDWIGESTDCPNCGHEIIIGYQKKLLDSVKFLFSWKILGYTAVGILIVGSIGIYVLRQWQWHITQRMSCAHKMEVILERIDMLSQKERLDNLLEKQHSANEMSLEFLASKYPDLLRNDELHCPAISSDLESITYRYDHSVKKLYCTKHSFEGMPSFSPIISDKNGKIVESH